MSDVIGSLEAIRDGLKAKIKTLPEVVALKRVEASILEISSVLAMINYQAPAVTAVAPLLAPTPVAAPAPVVAEVEDDEEELEDAEAEEMKPSAPTMTAPAINEAQFEAELSKLLVTKAA